MTIECKNCSMHEQPYHEIFDTVTGKRIKRIL